MVLDLGFRLWPPLSELLPMVWGRTHLLSGMGVPSVPSTICREPALMAQPAAGVGFVSIHLCSRLCVVLCCYHWSFAAGLESEMWILQLCSFLNIILLIILSPLNFHVNFRISLVSAKSQRGLDRGCVESINQFGVSPSSHPWTWGVFPLIWVLLVCFNNFCGF